MTTSMNSRRVLRPVRREDGTVVDGYWEVRLGRFLAVKGVVIREADGFAAYTAEDGRLGAFPKIQEAGVAVDRAVTEHAGQAARVACGW